MNKCSQTTSSKMAGRSIATQRTTYPSLSLVYRQVFSTSSSPTSPTSSSQETVTPTEQPASTGSENMSEEVQGNLSHDLPEWLQEFRHGLVDESVPEHRDASNSSHELSSEPRAKVVSGKHSIFTHFPKDRNCDICLRTKITRASCRKCTGTVVHRAENFGDLTTADHKVLNGKGGSRNNHRYAAVVQDLATQWIQSIPMKTKNFSGNTEELAKVPTIPKNLANLVKIFPGIILRQHRTDWKLMGLLREQCAESRKGHLLLQSGLDEKWWDSMELLSLGKLCDDEWINGQKPHLIKNGIRIPCNTENFVRIVVPGLSSSSSGSSSTSRTPSRQESHSSSSSSASSSSPTASEIQIRELKLIVISLQCKCQLRLMIDQGMMKPRKRCNPLDSERVAARIQGKFGG